MSTQNLRKLGMSNSLAWHRFRGRNFISSSTVVSTITSVWRKWLSFSVSVRILPVDCISDGFLELMRGSCLWKDRSLVWHRLSNFISSNTIASTITLVWRKWLSFSASVRILPVDHISDDFLELMRGSCFWKDTSFQLSKFNSTTCTLSAAPTIQCLQSLYGDCKLWHSARSIIHLLLLSQYNIIGESFAFLLISHST